jgi:hypothetical protein
MENRIGIVGAGFAGLYCALTLLDKYPNVCIELFEQQSFVGGRNKMGDFINNPVSNGAGIIRDRDVLLRKLCKRFTIPLKPFTSKIQYQFDTYKKTVKLYIQQLKKKSYLWSRRETFKQNFERILGSKDYLHFVELCGYSDFQNSDMEYTISYYGFQDITSGQKMFAVSWDNLAQAILDYCKASGRFTLHLNCSIQDVHLQNKGVEISCGYKSKILNFLIWSGAKPSWPILTNALQNRLWQTSIDQIQGQSFLRAYAKPLNSKEEKRAKKLYPCTTYFPINNPLQKIMVIEKPETTFYMLSYSDNDNAKISTQQLLIGPNNNNWIYQQTGIQWDLKTLKVYPHSCGTHFYKPIGLQDNWNSIEELLSYIQHPHERLYLCNEGLSFNQGWTEGALESALKVCNQIKHY